MALLWAAALLLGCVEEEETVVIPDRLKAVPSDAMAVISGRCRDCLSELDSAHVFRNIGLDPYARTDATLALCYTSSISPVLVLDARVDTAVLSNASRKGALVLEYADEDRTVFTLSESTMAAVKRHISTGTSILDAPDFREAVMQVVAGDRWAVLRNIDFSKLLPKNFLDGVYGRKDVARLVKNASVWTCFKWTGRRECEVSSMCGESNAYVFNMFASLKPSSSRLSSILPSSTGVAVDLMVDPKPFRKAYEMFMDATQRLSAYNITLDALERKSGESPLKWESRLDVCEVAMVEWENRKVVLVRPSASMEPSEPGANLYEGYPAALYGFPFALADDSFSARMDGWIVTGSENDVRVFLDEERPEAFDWPARPMKLAVYTPDAMFSWTRENIRIEYGF